MRQSRKHVRPCSRPLAAPLFGSHLLPDPNRKVARNPSREVTPSDATLRAASAITSLQKSKPSCRFALNNCQVSVAGNTIANTCSPCQPQCHPESIP